MSRADTPSSKSPATASRRAFLAGAAALGAAGAVAGPALAVAETPIAAMKRETDRLWHIVNTQDDDAVVLPAAHAGSDLDTKILSARAQTHEDGLAQIEVFERCYEPEMYDGCEEALNIMRSILALTAN